MVTLGDYLIVSGILFTIGFAGVMVRRNINIILMALELMLNAANLSLVAFSCRSKRGPKLQRAGFCFLRHHRGRGRGRSRTCDCGRTLSPPTDDACRRHHQFKVLTFTTNSLLPWLVLFLPLTSAGVITLFTRRRQNISALISVAAVLGSFTF